jgi:6-phosphogluconolactonase
MLKGPDGSIQNWDERRDIVIAGNKEETIAFAADHWIFAAKRAIQQRGRFAVALSGGSTPKAIYQTLLAKHRTSIDWSQVFLFWSDERAVPPDSPESNFKMAMQNGFSELPIPKGQIFRMKAETNIEQAASDYADVIKRTLGGSLFDLVMLGIGEDGHTASLFPGTKALQEHSLLTAANFIPEAQQHRMTLTFPCIEQSASAMVVVIGKSKQAIVPLVLQAAIVSPFPASKVGTHERKALWILDRDAAHLL